MKWKEQNRILIGIDTHVQRQVVLIDLQYALIASVDSI